MLSLPCITNSALNAILDILPLSHRPRRPIFRDPSLHSLVNKKNEVVELAVRHELLANLRCDHASARLHRLQCVRFTRRQQRVSHAFEMEVPPSGCALRTRKPFLAVANNVARPHLRPAILGALQLGDRTNLTESRSL